MPPGFITFEGSEGAGKSTQIKRLHTRLQAAGQPVTLTREPGGTPLGEQLRHLIKAPANDSPGLFPETELLLFAASRAQLVREVIRPALHAGHTVLCDRYADSTTVYQGVARQLPPGQVAPINAFAIGDTLPDLTFLLDLPAEAGLARAHARANHAHTPEQTDRMENEALAFYRAVRDGYRELARLHPQRFRVIDAAAPPDEVEAAIWHELRHFHHNA